MLTRVGLDWIEIEICILEMCIGIYIYIGLLCLLDDIKW